MTLNGLFSQRRESLELRQAARWNDKLTRRSRGEMAYIADTAILQSYRVKAIAAVGHQALNRVGLLSQIEQGCSAICPAATSRLAAVADVTSLQIIDVLAETGRLVAP